MHLNASIVLAWAGRGDAPWSLSDYIFAIACLGIVLVAMIRDALKKRRRPVVEPATKKPARRFRKRHR